MTSQYETNFWSTHVNIVRLAKPIRRCVRWRTQVFKIEGFVCKRFLPSPPPSFTFWLSFHFSRGQNWKSPSSVFLCSETKRKRLLPRLLSLGCKGESFSKKTSEKQSRNWNRIALYNLFHSHWWEKNCRTTDIEWKNISGCVVLFKGAILSSICRLVVECTTN